MREELENLLTQAEEDLKTANVLLENERYYASVFFSQQAAEKFLKTLYRDLHREPIFTHDLLRIAQRLNAPDYVTDAAAELTPDYLVTRCPDAAGGVPAELYNRANAEQHIEFSSTIMTWVKQQLQNR